MEKANKKELILITLLVIFTFITILLVILKFVYKEDKKNININQKTELDIVVEEINEVNKLFETIDKEDNSKYKLVEDKEIYCYKYKEDDVNSYIEKLEKLYINPFVEYGNFNITYRTKDDVEEFENLYLCLEKNCKVSQINDYEIVLEEQEKRIVRLENNEYTMKKVNDKWKFVYPVIICDNN